MLPIPALAALLLVSYNVDAFTAPKNTLQQSTTKLAAGYGIGSWKKSSSRNPWDDVNAGHHVEKSYGIDSWTSSPPQMKKSYGLGSWNKGGSTGGSAVVGTSTKTTPLPASVHAGVVTGQAMVDLLDHAKENGYAIPAVNCVSSSGINACLEAAARNDSPVIIQFSSGGSQVRFSQHTDIDRSKIRFCDA